MSFSKFLDDLYKSGQLKVPNGDEPDTTELEQANALISQMASERALEMAHTCPELNMEAAKWAALQIYRTAQFLSCPYIDAETVKSVLDSNYPHDKAMIDHSIIFSVDLYLS